MFYNADFLSSAVRGSALQPVQAAAKELLNSSCDLSATLTRLNEFAQKGISARHFTSLTHLNQLAQRLCEDKLKKWNVELKVTAPQNDSQLYSCIVLGSQILGELLCNAAEANPNGVVLLTFERGAPLDETWICRVEDEGPGISHQLKSRIYEPFVSTKQGRVGLGLTMARAFARQLGGDISFENTSSGCVFLLELPRTMTPPWSPSASGPAQ